MLIKSTIMSNTHRFIIYAMICTVHDQNRSWILKEKWKPNYNKASGSKEANKRRKYLLGIKNSNQTISSVIISGLFVFFSSSFGCFACIQSIVLLLMFLDVVEMKHLRLNHAIQDAICSAGIRSTEDLVFSLFQFWHCSDMEIWTTKIGHDSIRH